MEGTTPMEERSNSREVFLLPKKMKESPTEMLDLDDFLPAQNTLDIDLLSKLREDFEACDYSWSLFYSCVNTYKRDSLLRPFPPDFYDDSNEKDFEKLMSEAKKVPPLLRLVEDPSIIEDLDTSVVKLLKWVLDLSNFRLKTVDKRTFDEIIKEAGQTVSCIRPTHIFKVIANINHEEKFIRLKRDRRSFYAFHGSRVENFYSILHHGLHNVMCKNGLFGQGTYLSSELTVCFNYAPSGEGWQHSQLGDNLSCIAVCEIIDHPDVKCQIRDVDEKSRSMSKDSMAGEVPEKYYLVTNDELVCVRYLLVYANPKPAAGQVKFLSSSSSTVFSSAEDLDNQSLRPTASSLVPRRSSIFATQRAPPVVSFWTENKFLLSMIGYGLVLVAIGLANSSSFNRWLKRMWN